MKTTISEPEHPDDARQLTLNLNRQTFESLEAVVEHALFSFISAAEEGC